MKKLIFILKQIKSLLVFCFCSFDASFNQSHFFECFFSTFEKTYIQSLSDQIISNVQSTLDESLVKSHAKDEIIFVFRKLRKIISMTCIKTLKTRIYSRDFGCLSLILISFINGFVQIDVNALAQQVVQLVIILNKPEYIGKLSEFIAGM